MRRSLIALVPVLAALTAGCSSSSSSPSTPSHKGESDLLTREALAADWRAGVTSKGRWFARFASAGQIAFGCDVSDAKARLYHRRLEGTFPTSLLRELEADCEAS
jgi:hypothetical protein